MPRHLLVLLILFGNCLPGQSHPGLPPCPEGPLYWVLPMALEDFVAFRPLGFLSIPIHFFPAKHSSFILATPGEPAPQKPVLFPGDAWVVEILSTAFPNGGSGYQVQFQPCNQVRSYFYHLKDIAAPLKAAFDSAEQRCYDYSDPTGTIVKCQARVWVEVSAGEPAGMTGDGTSGVDFGLVDFRLEPKGFVDLNHYPFDYPYYASPLDYFPPEVKAQLEGKLASWDGRIPRTAEPRAGSHRLDTAGTAQGGWFFPGTDMRSNPENMTPHLALVQDYIDPEQPVFVIGTKVSGVRMGLYSFEASENGLLNRRFRDVTPDGNIYCYEGMRGGRTAGQLPLASLAGVLMISMPDETTLQLEKQGEEASTCESLRPWQFRENATRFQR